MKKRILCIGLALLLIITVLTGCGKNPDSSNPSSGETGKDIPLIANATDLGDLRISYNGDIYLSKAFKDEDSNIIYLPTSAVEKLTGETADIVEIQGIRCSSLSSIVDSCVYDEQLSSLYVWNNLPISDLSDISRISYYGLGEMDGRAITFKEYFAILDKAVTIADEPKLAQWQGMLTEARTSEAEMSRYEGAVALLYVATVLGSPYTEFNKDWAAVNNRIGGDLWGEIRDFMDDEDAQRRLPVRNDYTLGGFEDASYVYDFSTYTVAAFYGFGRCSKINGKLLFDYDSAENTMHYGEPLTVTDALCAVSRFLDSAEQKENEKEKVRIPIEDTALRHYDKNIITDAHLEHIKDMPAVSDDNLPIWNGVVLDNAGYVYSTNQTSDISLNEFSIRKLSEYGFNMVRYPLNYRTIFDSTAQNADPDALQELDAMIAMAMEYRIHLNLVTVSLPGRWTEIDPETYENQGDYDMFINPDKQKEAQAVWDLLAERYADIPNSVLSFSPLWETSNYNLSSGLEAPEYTASDIANAYIMLIETIRVKDDDRFIIYEPTALSNSDWFLEMAPTVVNAVSSRFNNIQMIGNFCEMPYVFSDMTDAEDANIDWENHGMFKPEYPAIHYGVNPIIEKGKNLDLYGELVKGTEFKLYLRSSYGPGKLAIYGDNELLLEEALPSGDKKYSVGNSLSIYIKYAKSDKIIDFSLDKNYEKISIVTDAFVIWSGMEVTLPDSYAVERWYYDSGYDADLEGRECEQPKLTPTSQILISPNSVDGANEITIHPDVSYTTDVIWAEASAQTMDAYASTVNQLSRNGVFRCENAHSSVGTSMDSAVHYYDDFFKTCEKYHFGWIMNDGCGGDGAALFKRDTSDFYTNYSGFKFVVCSDALVCKELLQLYQSHMEEPIKLD